MGFRHGDAAAAANRLSPTQEPFFTPSLRQQSDSHRRFGKLTAGKLRSGECRF